MEGEEIAFFNVTLIAFPSRRIEVPDTTEQPLNSIEQRINSFFETKKVYEPFRPRPRAYLY